jgi:tetratricopeptide (TPR) repeat protein
LGFLRREQGRSVEAAQYFKKAVELDPDYLNAWRELAALGQEGAVGMAEGEKIAINIIRLDPKERHGRSYDSNLKLKSFANYYNALNSAYSSIPEGEVLYTLSASKQKASSLDMMGGYREILEAKKSPGAKLAETEPMRSLIYSIMVSGRIEMDSQ